MKTMVCPICKQEKVIDEEIDLCNGCDRYICPDCSVGLSQNTVVWIDMKEQNKERRIKMNIFITEESPYSTVQAKKDLCIDTLKEFMDAVSCRGGSISVLDGAYFTWKVPNEIFESVEDILEKRFKLTIYYM